MMNGTHNLQQCAWQADGATRAVKTFEHYLHNIRGRMLWVGPEEPPPTGGNEGPAGDQDDGMTDSEASVLDVDELASQDGGAATEGNDGDAVTLQIAPSRDIAIAPRPQPLPSPGHQR